MLYDILRKLAANSNVELSLLNTNKLKLVSGIQNLIYCVCHLIIFQLSDEEIKQKNFEISSDKSYLNY